MPSRFIISKNLGNNIMTIHYLQPNMFYNISIPHNFCKQSQECSRQFLQKPLVSKIGAKLGNKHPYCVLQLRARSLVAG